jgi:sulfate adenylyltransferase
MQKPHGGKLVNRTINQVDTSNIPLLKIDSNTSEDILNIASGVFSPLEGFLCKNDLESVLKEKRLEDDTPWTIPILLSCDKKSIKGIKEGDTLLLKGGGTVALLEVEEIYTNNKKPLCKALFLTNDFKHPGVAGIYAMKDLLLGGKISLIERNNQKFDEYLLLPKETRFLFKEKGWKEIVAFQTRNPPHLGHEYIQKTALTFVDGIFINPIIGQKKAGDFKDEVIIKSYITLIKHYYLKERAVFSILRTQMKYAGPREAVHHAIMRKNFGCTHFIVGRDHAGIGEYYKPYDSHEIFSEFPDLGIVPVFFRSFSKCKKCGTIVNDKICPHNNKYHFSGTEIREIIRKGKAPPQDIMRKEVAETILSFKEPFVTCSKN